MLLPWSGRHPSGSHRDHPHAVSNPTLAIGYSSPNAVINHNDNIDSHRDTDNHPHRVYSTLSYAKLHSRANVHRDSDATPPDQYLDDYTNRYRDDYADYQRYCYRESSIITNY